MQLCFSSNDPNICAEAVADVILQGMDCFIPSSVVRLGGKSQQWYDRPSAEANRLKQDAFRAWTVDRVQKDPNTNNLRRKYNAVSRSTKRIMARAKF